MNHPASPAAGAAISGRRHDIDALRVLAFGLLILYHVGMFYVTWGWHVKSSYQSETLQAVMMLVNPWRMPLLFLISGLAVNFLLGKVGTATLAWRRIVRLGLPLLFGMAVVVPPQAYFQALSNGVIEPGYLDFLVRYFTFQPWPDGAFDGSDPGITWNHLWYLPYLLFYTLVLLPLIPLLDRLRGRFVRMRGWTLLLLPILPLMVIGLTVWPRFPYISHALLDDWYAHAMYGTIFIYGFLIGRDPGLWAELARLRKRALAMAVTIWLVYMFYQEVLPEDGTAIQEVATLVVVYLNRWFWLVAVLGWGHALLNHPFRWLPYANEAVYPWYILHQTITVAAGFYLAPLTLGPVAEPLLLIAITVGGCLAIHELVIRRTGWLRPCFGLHRRAGTSAGSAPSAASASESAAA